MRINISKNKSLEAAWSYFTLLIWILPLLVFNNGQHSLMPQDEAVYGVRARWMLESGDWVTPQSWGELVYEKTPGPYWLLAASYTLFGISEATSRLPSLLFCLLSVLLTYEIGLVILNKRIAWLASAILAVSFLWVQGSRLATANIPMVSMALLGIWCLLKAELHLKHRFYWSAASGLSFGLGFLIRGQMIFLPMIALLPYLFWEHRRHKHLSNPAFYIGFGLGLIPTISWFWVSWLRYGTVPFAQFFALVYRIASEQRNSNSPFFYLWNIPVKAFPWPFFSVLGLILILRKPIPRHQLVLVGCPLIILVGISFVSTRLPHYALVLYPFIAMLAAVSLDWLSRSEQNQFSLQKWLSRGSSYTFGALGCLLFLVGIVLHAGIALPSISLDAEIRKYGAVALVLGLSWLTLPLVWISHHRGKTFVTARYWLASWLIGPWLALAIAGSTGLLGNYNPNVKTFLQQPAIAAVLQTYPINFVVQQTQALTTGGDKTLLLLTFYTPHLGQRFNKTSELRASNYAWVSPEFGVELSNRFHRLGTFQGWQLIQVLETKALGD